MTNAPLDAAIVGSEHKGLWVVERAFRISKSSLEIRDTPYVSTSRNAELRHMHSICFIAYKVYKELERVIKSKDIALNVDKVLETDKIIATTRVNMPENKKVYTKTLFLTEKRPIITPLFDPEKPSG